MAKVKAQVSEVKGIMMENIEKVSLKFPMFLTKVYLDKSKYILPCVYVSFRYFKTVRLPDAV